ncbi:DUF1178 family protein [Asaia bogorensis]|uniref:DUF1178 family protein n=1 Tax=Asaia bogorensis TaxID=91915 RepID=UPI000EFBEC66|nr:DUF1178 family protein [Asaia bogorensis]
MICFRLHCTAGHEFEGWFPDGAGFERQKSHGLVSCPQCGVSTVEKSLMAPAIARQTTSKGQSATPAPSIPMTQNDQLRMALHVLRRQVEAQCDNVGDRFAEEALKRHDEGNSENSQTGRGIYGTMSDSDRERLEDEGVDFSPIPWLDRTES